MTLKLVTVKRVTVKRVTVKLVTETNSDPERANIGDLVVRFSTVELRSTPPTLAPPFG